MIVREHSSTLRTLLSIKGSVLPKIFREILLAGLFASLLLIIDRCIFELPTPSINATGILGIALSLFLGFRNNAAYQRWWEARQLWGTIIAETRTFARDLSLFSGQFSDSKDVLKYLTVFAHIHRGELRRTDVRAALVEKITSNQIDNFFRSANASDAVLAYIGRDIRKLADKGYLSEFGMLKLSKTLSKIGRAQAGCERIATTPLPFVYSLLVYRTTYIYCFILPFSLIEATGWFAPLFSMIAAYVFFGLHAVTNQLETPFSKTDNGIPLDAMCRTIERSVADALSEIPPNPITPRNYVLT